MKIKKEELNQVRLDFIDVETWIKVRKSKDHKCKECGILYKDQESKIALLTIHKKPNRHICNECGKKYIELGAIDVLQLIKDNEKQEELKKMEAEKIENVAKFDIIPKEITDHVKKYCDKNGWECLCDDDIMEILSESSEVYSEIDGEHRWYEDKFIVVNVDGLLIGYDGFHITGDNGMSDMGLEYDLSSISLVEKKQKTIDYYSRI